MANGAMLVGPIVKPQMRLAAIPVAAPAMGPARTPTTTVPIESRYSGSRMTFCTMCPTAMLMAIATAISTIVGVVNDDALPADAPSI